MRPDDEGQSFRHYCRAMGNGLEERRRERDGRSDNGGRRTNPFNRESIYITDLPNNNSVSSARWSRVISRHLAICRSRTLAACCQFRGWHSTRMRAIQNFHPFHSVDRICATSPASALRGYLPLRRP